MSIRLYLVIPLFASVALVAADEPLPPIDPHVLLGVESATGQREFQIGEIIPLQLAFSSRVNNQYQLNEASYDRSGRMHYEHFSVTPAKGAVDPLPPEALGMMGGGLTNFIYLEPKPWKTQLNLNEWVRFNEPGEYRLTVSSERVEVKDLASPQGTSPVIARSNPFTLKILPLDRDWQREACARAVAIIDTNPAEGARAANAPPSAVETAWNTLRYLGTPEAARELAKRLRGEGSGNEDFYCYMGLVCSPAQAVARDALKEALADPNHPIGETFLDALLIVDSKGHPKDPYGEKAPKARQAGQRRVIEELIAVLPAKRGQALSLSLDTAVHVAWRTEGLSPQTVEKLVDQLIAMFDQLPPREQSDLLANRWEKIRRPSLLPVVRRYAQVSREFLKGRAAESWESSELIASAIKRWFELDPDNARPFIIKEITQPAPRFGARVLGILPDERLPEVESQLAAHLLSGADDDSEAASNVASLIVRYATAAILPQVLPELDAHIGKWACLIQNSILAYVLRADPSAARLRVERALALRGKNCTWCYKRLLMDVAAIRYDPVLEEIAIHALGDCDPEVAMDAADMLGQFGSATAEPALWRRYASWSHQWAGREAELSLTEADEEVARSNQRRLGLALMKAIATGEGWLTTSTKLRSLKGMNKVFSNHWELENFIKAWNAKALNIELSLGPSYFSARVAQYHYDSMDALQDKLRQFPAKTAFVISNPRPAETKADGESRARLRRFLTSHGMSLAK